MIKKTFTSVRVPCMYYDIKEGTTVEHCQKCGFFNGLVKNDKDEVTGVDCLRSEIPQLRCHVTAFIMSENDGEYEYKARMYDKNIDGPIEGDDPYDFCQKCCFNKKLSNGKEKCFLRCGAGDDIERFMCYEGEIWEKKKVEYDENED